jgi:hypothetical protein
MYLNGARRMLELLSLGGENQIHLRAELEFESSGRTSDLSGHAQPRAVRADLAAFLVTLRQTLAPPRRNHWH